MDSKQTGRTPFVFPRWANALRLPLTIGAVTTPLYLAAIIYLSFSPGNSSVGYAPEQPVPYSHQLHAGELGIDCRYCHTGVEIGRFATIPPTQTCMNCHATIKTQSEKLALVRESFATG